MNKNGLTGIVPFTYFVGGGKAVGSTFLRVDGVVNNSSQFEVWRHGKQYDNLIFQKVYWREMMEVFKGPKILDLCDPDWVTDLVEVIEIGKLVDAFTCSSPELTTLIKNYFPEKPVVHVPDRLNFNLFTETRTPHTGLAKNVLWFGFIHNAYQTLPDLYATIREYGLKLTIVADFPYDQDDEIKTLEPQFIQYDQQTVYQHIRQADIVLNPRSSRALYKFKSNNKSLIGWKLGVPVAENSNDIIRLMDATARNKEVSDKLPIVNEHYNVQRSVEQYQELLSLLRMPIAQR